MAFALGVTLFALGIAVSIALHEAGHLLTAKYFGMKVRRYFIGFGPKIFSFRRGETEYGLKAIPAGGFCDIAGMTALDPVTPDEVPRAFFRKPTWQRVVVLSAGSVTHFAVGILLLYVLLLGWGQAQADDSRPTAVGQVTCAADQVSAQAFAPCGPGVPAPAAEAGLRSGDQIVAVAGTPTPTWAQVVTAIRDARGPTPVVVERDGAQVPLVVDVVAAQRFTPDGQAIEVGAIGVAPQPPQLVEYGPLSAIPATFELTGTMFERVWQGILLFPEKIPRLVDAIAGEPRDIDTPVSVVGASVLGGEAVDRGLWEFFILLLAALNFFIGVFNLLPLLPLDGGHIMVNLYERARDWTRSRLGKVPMPPVDYTRLLPITFVLILVGGAVSLLTLTADIVNPIPFPE
ncbi:MAG: M50 family metallopeptidase [Pseudonocardia sp.]